MAFVGFGFGAAVGWAAAARLGADAVAAVVSVSGAHVRTRAAEAMRLDTPGAIRAMALVPKLWVHGVADASVAPSASRAGFELAAEPKCAAFVVGGEHRLDIAREAAYVRAAHAAGDAGGHLGAVSTPAAGGIIPGAKCAHPGCNYRIHSEPERRRPCSQHRGALPEGTIPPERTRPVGLRGCARERGPATLHGEVAVTAGGVAAVQRPLRPARRAPAPYAPHKGRALRPWEPLAVSGLARPTGATVEPPRSSEPRCFSCSQRSSHRSAWPGARAHEAAP